MTAKEEYALYLRSPHWRSLRDSALSRDHRRCRRCGKNKSLEVHHIFYRRNWRDTRIEDLVTLCAKHHEQVHRILDKPKPVPVVDVAPVPAPKGEVFGLEGFEKKPKTVLIGWTNKQFSHVKKKKKGTKAWRKGMAKAQKKRKERQNNFLAKKKRLGWSF